ncbi:MAG: multicopper oxidase family protein [Mariniblastus sp.]|nr:multicopper oxidase family protein [Mariniblastus sp.]
MQPRNSRLSRRRLLQAGAGLPFALSAPIMAQTPSPSPTEQEPEAVPVQAKPDYVCNLEQSTIAPLGVPTSATLINGSLPGTEIRYREGDMFRVLVNNRLAVPTSLHWHGMLVPNYMDGVPDVTQLPIGAGESVLYEYPIRQSGTYWYHSHYNFQEQTGMSGTLIVEAKDEPWSYDHDVVVTMSDWLNQEPEGIIPQFRGQQPETAAVKPPPGDYKFPGDQPFNVDINYPGYLLNGRSNKSPWTQKVRAGDRIRLRLINASTSTFFQVMLDGHRMQVIAADGQNVDPIDVDNLVIATAERYDVLVTIGQSGSFSLRAAALGTSQQVVGVIHTADVAPQPNLEPAKFTGKSGGMANYSALKSPLPTTLPKGPVKEFEIDLGGEMNKYLWSMGGEYYPELFSPDGQAKPLEIRQGDRVRIRMTNSTMMFHPMHLHGHFFRLLPQAGAWDDPLAPLKDTVGVGPKQKIDIEFIADNPGSWFFHCHNLYHLASGMARVVQYTV